MSSNTLIYIIAGSVVLTLGLSVVIFLVMRSLQMAAPNSRELGWFRRWRESKYFILIPAVVVPIVFLMFTAFTGTLISGGSLLLRSLDNLPMAGVFAFMPFMSRARVSVGGLLCTKCKYNVESLAPPIPDGQTKRPVHDVVCPECGSQFGWPGGTTSESYKWQLSRVVIPAMCLLPIVVQFGSIPFAGILWWKSVLHRVVPTASLVKEVTTSRSFTMAAWDELGRRELTAAEDRQIATHLLSPPPKQFFNSDERRWLSAAVAAQAIDSELISPWINRLVAVSQLPSVTDRRVQVKCDTTYLMPLYDMSATLQLMTDPPTQQSPVTIQFAGTQPYASYWVGQVSETTKRAWIVVAIHVPGEVVTMSESDEVMKQAPKVLYFTKIPIEMPSRTVAPAAR